MTMVWRRTGMILPSNAALPSEVAGGPFADAGLVSVSDSLDARVNAGYGANATSQSKNKNQNRKGRTRILRAVES
jgi:hypothetical protein